MYLGVTVQMFKFSVGLFLMIHSFVCVFENLSSSTSFKNTAKTYDSEYYMVTFEV